MKRTLLALLCLALSLPTAAQRREEILAYNSEITVHQDGSMLVRETIRVRAAGEQIKRGIYRDFPTRYRDQYGNRYTVLFQLAETLRNGRPENRRIEELSNGVRVYLGSSDVILRPGVYTYTIAYRTDRQLGFFSDHDELYWNVTGNGWAFPIREASATVHLPPGISADDVRLEGYTGPQGAKGEEFAAEAAPDGSFVFNTTAPLGPEEGLTIVVSFPKGFVREPTREQRLAYFAHDNRPALIGLGGLAAVLLYYLVVWMRVGKDPEPGAIMPLYEPPQGFSPAAVRYLAQMGFDDKTFAAAVVDMAVKGHLKIREDDGVYTLERIGKSDAGLTPDEKKISSALFGGSQSVMLKTANHAKISAAIEGLKKSLAASLEKVYFLRNSVYVIPGVVLSVVTLLGMALAVGGEGVFVAGFMSVWLTIWSLGVYGLLTQVLRLWRTVFRGPSGRVAALGGAIFLTLFSLPFIAGEIFGIAMLGWATTPFVVVALLGFVMLHVLFYHLMKAPTVMGRRLLDQIEGFKMFMGPVEEHRMNVLYPPEQTPQVFERFLPYALALDVEQHWAEKFAGVLAQAAAAPGATTTAYRPGWYSGSSYHDFSAGSFASSLGSSFSSAISSSSTPPGSSSGSSGGSSGGGSSGGGGGGGGGGGW